MYGVSNTFQGILEHLPGLFYYLDMMSNLVSSGTHFTLKTHGVTCPVFFEPIEA